MRFARTIRFLFGVIAASTLAVPAAAAVVSETPFVGVTHYTLTDTLPRPSVIHIVVVDLSAPGIRVENTGGNGDPDPATAVDENGETTLETTTAFVDRVGAQLAINTSFSTAAGRRTTTSAC